MFTEEPPPKDNKLVLHENVTATPHLGASTSEAQVYQFVIIISLICHYIFWFTIVNSI